ncbi:c-type cytochrome [Seohaeicola saemankumensis]|nr:c-type cytochrome [Seohaeicola saemankumensis]MCA0869834.1 c-type cytochrome [Seohaeicola saemankumensis]
MRLAALILALWPSLGTAQEFFTLKGHGGPVMDIATAADGTIATASFDNSVGLWRDGAPQWLDGHEAAVNTVLFDGDTVLSGSDDFTVRLWSSPGRIIGRHQGKVMGLAAAPGLIASASWDGSIGLWPLDGAASRQLTGHQAGVNAVAFSADHRTLYSASTDGTLRSWDVATGLETAQILRHGFGINELVLNHDAGWLAYGAVDGVTRVIDITTGAELRDFTLDRRPILALALSPDGGLLAVGDGEGYIMVIDTTTWRIARDFRATLRGPVWALAFSPDGQNIHAGGLDDAMYSWPVASLAEHGQMADTERSFLRDPGEMENGERQFARKCSICHALGQTSARKAGPTLYRLFGRRAGTVTDYSYSDTLTDAQIIWDADSINALFDLGPDHYIPGTKMPMQRIADPADRADLVDYLRRATQPE